MYSCKKYTIFPSRVCSLASFFFLFFPYISVLSVSLSVSFFFLSLLQALANTNSFCQGICGCVWIETETWEHWACLLLIEYAWLGLPEAVSDERRMKMLMFVELSWNLQDLFNLTYAPNKQSIGGWLNCFRGRIHFIPRLIGSEPSRVTARSWSLPPNFFKVCLWFTSWCNKLWR